ncbi:hypothetical protein C3F00_006465 [Pseudomonas sp. MWU13-2860]|nr:hypothetical protein C3F00_006465 [Pseudomonas sp. MWU13-2860]
MVYLLTDVNAAHTSPLGLPPLGHVDSIEGPALHALKNASSTTHPEHWHNPPNLRSESAYAALFSAVTVCVLVACARRARGRER